MRTLRYHFRTKTPYNNITLSVIAAVCHQKSVTQSRFGKDLAAGRIYDVSVAMATLARTQERVKTFMLLLPHTQ